MSTLQEINHKARAILSRELGPAECVLFFRQFETEGSDYTRDRWQWLEDDTIEDIAAEARRLEAELDAASAKSSISSPG